MSHLNPGLISAYNSLTDKHLAGYFSNTRIRRHLQRAGLITRSGRIVPDKEYRHRLTQRQHQRHVRECLAQAIFHKVLEMERAHQTEIKRRLEEFAKRERVHKIKLERSNRYEEDSVRVLSPRPPTGARVARQQRSAPEGDRSESSESPGSSRPNTAPGKMQRPVRLKPIPGNRAAASLRRVSPYGPPDSSAENEQPLSCTVDPRRRLTGLEAPRGISPYCLPVINTFVTPVPPPTKRKEPGSKVAPRGRRLRPYTVSAAKANEDAATLRSSVQQCRVSVNMVYFGKKVHLSHDLHDTRDEVKVFQQHCGGENLCVYKGLLHRGETFQFTSRRHRGFPFSLTFFLNGLQVERLSSCCEFKHRRASRLRGRHRHFGFCGVEGASPCYKCIIAMGLDKQPTPPPKWVRGDRGGGVDASVSPTVPPDTRRARNGEDGALLETSRPGEAEARVREDPAAVEGRARDGYEEDFEADDEGPAEDGDAQGKTSSTPGSQSKERSVSETEDDGNEDLTPHPSSSSSSSSSSGSDREDSEAETGIDRPKQSQPEDADVPPEERAQPSPGETSEVEPRDPEVQNSAEGSTDIAVIDSAGTDADASGAENLTEEGKQEEEQERAKSVQEKLAEAVLKESQYSSEPELSDTSTDDEEDVQRGGEQDSKGGGSGEEPGTGTEREAKQGLENESAAPDEEQMGGDVMVEKVEEKIGSNDAAEEPPAEIRPPGEAESTSLPPENKREEKSSRNPEDGGRPAEVGREAESSGEDGSRPGPNEKAENETAWEDNGEAGATVTATAAETMEMKEEALSREEAPAADEEERPREGGEVGPAPGNAGVTEGTRAETSGDAPKAERDDKDVGAEEVASAGGEVETKQSVQTHEEVEEKAEEEEKQADAEEMGREGGEDDQGTNCGSNVGGEKREENTADGETDQSQKTDGGEDDQCVKDGNEEDDKSVTHTGEKVTETYGEDEKGETEETKAEERGAGENDTGDKEEKEGGRPSSDQQGENMDAESAEEEKKAEGSTLEPEDEAANAEAQEATREASGEEKDIDGENGETSSAQRDAEEAESEAQNDGKTAEHTDEIKAKEATGEERAEVKGSTEGSGGGTDRHEPEQTDPTPDVAKEEESPGDRPGMETEDMELKESCHIPEEDNVTLIKEVPPLNDGAPEPDVSVEVPEIEGHPPSAVTDPTAVREDSGETEASKASEEGASVVLNPRAPSPKKDESPAAHPEITEIVEEEENVDLVSNWVTTHQVAKFFETFVEPLDDLKETRAEVAQQDRRIDGPVELVREVDEAGREPTEEEATEVERESNGEKDPAEGKVQAEEETCEVVDLMLEEEPSQELPKGLSAGSEGSRTSLRKDKGQESFVQIDPEEDRVSTPGGKDGTGSHCRHSGSGGSPEPPTEQEEPNLNPKPTPVEEFGELQPEEPPRFNGDQPEKAQERWEAGEKASEADFIYERAREEPEEPQPKPADPSVGGEEADLRLVQDLQQGHSRDRLSVSSLNDTNLGRSSYPLLAAVRTQHGP